MRTSTTINSDHTSGTGGGVGNQVELGSQLKFAAVSAKSTYSESPGKSIAKEEIRNNPPTV
jgi:hypothetical protein